MENCGSHEENNIWVYRDSEFWIIQQHLTEIKHSPDLTSHQSCSASLRLSGPVWDRQGDIKSEEKHTHTHRGRWAQRDEEVAQLSINTLLPHTETHTLHSNSSTKSLQMHVKIKKQPLDAAVTPGEHKNRTEGEADGQRCWKFFRKCWHSCVDTTGGETNRWGEVLNKPRADATTKKLPSAVFIENWMNCEEENTLIWRMSSLSSMSKTSFSVQKQVKQLFEIQNFQICFFLHKINWYITWFDGWTIILYIWHLADKKKSNNYSIYTQMTLKHAVRVKC